MDVLRTTFPNVVFNLKMLEGMTLREQARPSVTALL
jgi:hypothetical protein